MNRIFLSLLFCMLIGAPAFAQGNLQFNQVIKLDLVGAPVVGLAGVFGQIAIQNVTIPPGKVWKIESVTSNATRGQVTTNSLGGLYSPTGTSVIYMDNSIIHTSIPPASATNVVVQHQIYWLPAGPHTFALWQQQVTAAQTFTYTGTITAIEFNIVP